MPCFDDFYATIPSSPASGGDLFEEVGWFRTIADFIEEIAGVDVDDVVNDNMNSA
jgi:hypothetical protein